jgi:hypothetical protein
MIKEVGFRVKDGMTLRRPSGFGGQAGNGLLLTYVSGSDCQIWVIEGENKKNSIFEGI